ncbi:MAG TPA: hypothetical protein DD631_07370 [Acholeplasmataceae bacterium]|nr:hypothetical protein [Acholeplasmataceae bacterium]
MTKEKIKLLSLISNHIKCAINLYGMIHKEKLCDIFCHHYPDYKKEEVLPLLDDPLSLQFVYFSQDYYIHEALYFENLMDTHLNDTKLLPYYVPNLQTFLKYSDNFYVERTAAYLELTHFLLKILPQTHHSKIDSVVDDLTIGVQMDLSLDHAIMIFERYQLPIKELDTKKLLDKVVNFYKQTRTWKLHGFTKNEMNYYQKFGNRLPLNQSCDCESGKTYGECCYHDEKVFLNHIDEEDHRFQITDDMITDYKHKLLRESDRIIFYHTHLTHPSLRDLIKHFIEHHMKDISRERPKDALAALALLLMRLHHIEDQKIPKEKILRTLGNWTYRQLIEGMSQWLEVIYHQKPVEFNHIEDLQHSLDAYFKDYPVKKEPNKGYTWLEKSLEKATYDEEHVDRVHDLVFNIKEAQHPLELDYFKLLLKTCPTAFLAIAFLVEVSEPKDHLILLKCYIKAFEICHQDVLSNPPKNFTHYGYNKEYILALDSIGLLYKENGNYKLAFDAYQKMIKYDDEDRFGAKESILICYVMTNQMEAYDDAIHALPVDSLYRKVLMMFHKMLMGESFYEEYLVLLKDHEDILDVIIGIKSPDSFPFDTPEGSFFYDFYQVLTYQKELLEPLLSLHKGNQKPLN